MKDKKYWISIIVLSLIFIVNTILVVCGKTTLFDNFIYNAVRSLECGFFDKYFIFITKFGNVSVVIGIVSILIMLLEIEME